MTHTPHTHLHDKARSRALQWAALVLTALLCWASVQAQPVAVPAGTPQMNLPRSAVTAGLHRLEVQLADTHPTRQTGLMYRQHMPEYEGMLFVFEQPGVQCFWMRNTLIPLTAAFVADDGTIVNLADMEPLDERSHCSTAPVRYVLETNQGWFEARNLRPGHRLAGPMFREATLP